MFYAIPETSASADCWLHPPRGLPPGLLNASVHRPANRLLGKWVCPCWREGAHDPSGQVSVGCEDEVEMCAKHTWPGKGWAGEAQGPLLSEDPLIRLPECQDPSDLTTPEISVVSSPWHT